MAKISDVTNKHDILKNINEQNIKIGLISLGCSKNQVDLERMIAILEKNQFDIVQDIDLCEVVIINTCGFIESARQESIDEISCCVALKKNNSRLKLIVVTGCLAERYGKNLRKIVSEIDVIVGIGGNKNIAEIITDALDDTKKTEDVFLPKSQMMMCGKRILTTPSYFAYLKIADGCNNRCTYCAIPEIRGNYRSTSIEILKEEAQELVSRGVRELNIVAQDVTSYGLDIYGRLALPELLTELCKIKDLKWIRLLYCYPDKITDELIDVMAREEKILNYIDIPFQHVNNRILKNMNRKGDKDLILSVISRLRKSMPDIAIRSTFIVGFPGETEEDFEELLEFLKEQKLDKVGCFEYSPEEGTKSAEFECQISDEVKKQRYEIFMNVQDQVIQEKIAGFSGKELKVLVEGFDKETGLYFGRSYMEAPDMDGFVEFDLNFDSGSEKSNSDFSIKAGDFVFIKL